MTHIDPDGQFAFLIPLILSCAISTAIDCVLPTAVAYAEQYAGSSVAAIVSGLANGYNLTNAAHFAEQGNLTLLEKGSMFIGGALGLGGNIIKKGASLLASETASIIGSQAGKRVISRLTSKTARESAREAVTTTVTDLDKIVKKTKKVAKREIRQISKVESVIEETIKGSGDIVSQIKLSSNEALEAGMRFLGKNYKELGRPGSGIFRSADGLRQFRIDLNSLKGKHDPWAPHVHLEAFKPNIKDPYINNHILFYD